MKKAFIFLLSLVGIGFIGYRVGPRPKKPDLKKMHKFSFPDDPEELTNWLKTREISIKNLKPDNAAEIIWADSSQTITEYAIVYIHGFSASHEEGAPVHENLARRFGANLFKARMFAHGIDRGTETMSEFNADDYIQSGEEALAIGKKLGKKVILVATSAGAAMSLYLASKHPEIQAMALYSPCIEIYDSNAKLLDDPWGLKLAEMITGKPYKEPTEEEKSIQKAKFWSQTYSIKALVGLQNFITHTMTPETFKRIQCPVFLGYYYLDEQHQDNVVSVQAELRMFEQLGSELKEKVAFPKANDHVLASWVVSKDVQNVQQKTEDFLAKAINK